MAIVKSVLIVGASVLLFRTGGVKAVPPQEEKLTAEEVVRLHLESLGDAEMVLQRQTFALVGTCKHEVLVGPKTTTGAVGSAQLVSKGNGINFLIDFGRPDYNGEQFITDGKKATTGASAAGTRFPLAEFLFTQKAILREGLFGGALTVAWPLLKLEEKQPRLKWKGKKKKDGRELHELEYRIRKRGGEDFSGVNLPATWVVQVSPQQTGRTSLWQWTMKFDQSSASQEIPDSFFQVK